jgi:hypothetical protein
MRMFGSLVVVAVAAGFGGAVAAPASVVPPGWRMVPESGDTARTFVSPDGSARIRFGHEPAHSGDPQSDANRFLHKQREQVTYQRRGASWFVVSGYRDGEIFYRKGNLACRGSRWNLIEFRYPRDAKRKMDATVAMVAHNMTDYRNDCR